MAELSIKVDTRSLDVQEARQLEAFIKTQADVVKVSTVSELQESIHPYERVWALIVYYGPYVGAAVGSAVAERLVNATVDTVKNWFRKPRECKHRTIPILGPNGETVRVVECEEKHPLEH